MSQREEIRPIINVDAPLSRRRMAALLKKAGNHTINLKDLGVLGSDQKNIARNLVRLLDRTDAVEVTFPPLVIEKRFSECLKAIHQAEVRAALKRKMVSRIVFAFIDRNQHALTRPVVQTIDIYKRAVELRRQNFSYRAISKILSEGGISISRSSVARILSNDRFWNPP